MMITLKPLFTGLLSNKKTIIASSFMLIVLLAWFLGQLLTSFLVEAKKPQLYSQNINVNIVNAQGTASYIFDKPDEKVLKAPPKVDLTEVKKTRLNLNLVGVIYMGKNSLALIKKGNKTLLVSKDEEIIPGVVLVDIFAEQVVIKNRTVQERLHLTNNRNILLASSANIEKTSDIETGYDGSHSISARDNKALAKVSKALRQAPMSISQFIKFQPINKDGIWAGVKIWSKNDRDLFNAVGFAEGDMLVNVNGRSIHELAQNPRLWQEFLKENLFELIVERNGLNHHISVDLSGS